MKGEPVTTVTLQQPIKLSNGGNTVFAPGVNLENFSARLDGTFKPTRDETVTFTISVDDKLRLLVNGDTLINSWRTRDRIQDTQKELKRQENRETSPRMPNMMQPKMNSAILRLELKR